jgi:anti-anti-sigma regulatory factor
MIVGFPYQTPEIIAEELQGLLSKKPVLSQFLIYGPTPGTPFYDNIMKEGLLHQDLTDDREKYYKSCTGFKAMVKHPHMSPDEIENQQKTCFEIDYQQLGPSIFRFLDTFFQGYKTLRHSDRPLLRLKAEWYANEVRKGYPIFLAGKFLGPNRSVRSQIRALEKEIYATLGTPTLKERFLSIAAVGAALWTHIKLKLNISQHPAPQRHVYRLPEEAAQPHPLWQRLRDLDLPVSVELKSNNTVIVRLEKILNEMEAKKLGANLQEALKRKKDKLVLDLAELAHLESNAAKQLAISLQDFRDKIRLKIPTTFTQPDTARWFTHFATT